MVYTNFRIDRYSNTILLLGFLNLSPDPIANALVRKVNSNIYASWIGSGVKLIPYIGPDDEKEDSGLLARKKIKKASSHKLQAGLTGPEG